MSRLIWRRWRGRQPTGIDRVSLAYLRHFAPRAQGVVQHEQVRRILDWEASQRLFPLLLRTGPSFKSNLIKSILRDFWRVSSNGEGRLYFNVGHTGLNSDGLRHWVAAANVRPIYLVHDLIPITHPQFCRAGEDTRHRNRMLTVLQTAAGVIGNSQATIDELAGFAASQGMEMPPSLPAWLGIDRLPPSPEAASPLRPTFVTLGTIEARKNHMLLLGIWSRLVERLGSDAPRLLIIGQRGWEAQPVLDLLDHDERLRGHVVELNDCSDERLAQHLGSARALLFPSFAEGYGLPLVEALDSSVPVIASDLPVLREIGGNIPVFLEPDNQPAWEAAILDYADPHSAARAAQLKRLEAFRTPDWPAHFKAVEAWLESLP